MVYKHHALKFAGNTKGYDICFNDKLKISKLWPVDIYVVSGLLVVYSFQDVCTALKFASSIFFRHLCQTMEYKTFTRQQQRQVTIM